MTCPPDSAVDTLPAAAPQPLALMQFYEAIEAASVDMVEAARIGDWDRVVRLEGACTVLIAQLRQTAASTRLTREQSRRKTTLLQRILLNDAEVRHLADPWQAEVASLLRGSPDQPVLH